MSVFEINGKIQTDFLVRENQVLKRQSITSASDHGPVGGESMEDYLYRHSQETLTDALSIMALEGAARAAEVRRRSLGEPVEVSVTNDLVAWMLSAKPVDLSL